MSVLDYSKWDNLNTDDEIEEEFESMEDRILASLNGQAVMEVLDELEGFSTDERLAVLRNVVSSLSLASILETCVGKHFSDDRRMAHIVLMYSLIEIPDIASSVSKCIWFFKAVADSIGTDSNIHVGYGLSKIIGNLSTNESFRTSKKHFLRSLMKTDLVAKLVQHCREVQSFQDVVAQLIRSTLGATASPKWQSMRQKVRQHFIAADVESVYDLLPADLRHAIETFSNSNENEDPAYRMFMECAREACASAYSETIKKQKNAKKLCAYCGIEKKKLKQCSRCLSVWYCGRVCQKKHFKIHKKVCKELKF